MRNSSISLSLDDMISVEVSLFDEKVLCQIDDKGISINGKVNSLDKSYLIGYHLNKLDVISGEYEELLSKINEFKSVFKPIVLINLNGKINVRNLSNQLIYINYKSKKGNERFNLY